VNKLSKRRISEKINITNPVKIKQIYNKTVLPNGIRIVTEEIPHVRSLSLGFWIDTGSQNETEENNGISHFIEHMAFKGTKKRSAREIAQSIESVGGYLNAFTSKEHTCFYARVLDEHLELAMDILSDIVFSSTFPRKELEKEKQVVIEEIKRAEDDPDDIIHDYFDKVLFKDHPLSMPVLGREETVKLYSRRSLFQYRKCRYTAKNLVIASAGNITHKKVVELAKKYVEKIDNDEQKSEKMVNQELGIPNAVISEYYKPILQAHICMGTLGMSIRDERRFAMQVLNTLLGDGMSSRLFQNIREKYGFAYSVYSFNNMMKYTGSTGVYIGTDDSHVLKCMDLVWKELRSIKKKGISKSELERTKEQLKGSIMLGMENIPNRMIRLGSSELYFGKFISLDTIISGIEAVRREDVQEIAEQLFSEDRFATVIFHPTQKSKDVEKKVR